DAVAGLLDGGDLEAHAEAAADPGRGWGADPVEAVVEGGLDPLDDQDLLQPGGERGEGVDPVGDGGPERPGRGPFGVDVDPLLVVGEGGELRDVLLGDLVPAAVAPGAAGQVGEVEVVAHNPSIPGQGTPGQVDAAEVGLLDPEAGDGPLQLGPGPPEALEAAHEPARHLPDERVELGGEGRPLGPGGGQAPAGAHLAEDVGQRPGGWGDVVGEGEQHRVDRPGDGR